MDGSEMGPVDPGEHWERAAPARDAGSGAHHVRAAAEHLPFADMPAAMAEIGRVLRPGGLATVSIVHPLADRGAFASRDPDADFALRTSWFGRRGIDVVDERDGLRMHFAGWVHTLPDYVAALRAAGLAMVDLAEPTPDAGANERLAGRWDRVPMFCWFTAVGGVAAGA